MFSWVLPKASIIVCWNWVPGSWVCSTVHLVFLSQVDQLSTFPLAELLSQLSGVRRSAGGQLNSSGPSASQLQQLQMQLQLERQHAQAARQQLETARNASRRTNTSSVTTTITQSTATANTANTENSQQALQNSQFLLTRYFFMS